MTIISHVMFIAHSSSFHLGFFTDCLDSARDFAHLFTCQLGYSDRVQNNRLIWPSVMGELNTHAVCTGFFTISATNQYS